MSETSSDAPQQILGEYTIERRLPGDSRSDRYLTRQTLDDGRVRHLVVSKLRPPHNRDEKQKRALRKAINRGRFSHPNVVEILNVLSSPDEFLIVSEYIKGASLGEVLERSRNKGIPLSLGYVTRIITALCDSLDYAFHAQGPDGNSRHICHGQVTPGNVWISMEGKVKVSNFQVGVVLREMAPPSATEYTGLFSYLAPEDAREGQRNLQSDIFSTGVILYEMTMGQPLFERDSDEDSRAAVMEAPIAPPSSVHSDFPVALESALMLCLSREPRTRFATAAQLAQAVRGSLEGHTELANRTALATFMRMLFPERADRSTGVWQSPTYVGPNPMMAGPDVSDGPPIANPEALSPDMESLPPGAVAAQHTDESSILEPSQPGTSPSLANSLPDGTPAPIQVDGHTPSGISPHERTSPSQISRLLPLPPADPDPSGQELSEASGNPVTGASLVKVFRATPMPGEQIPEAPEKSRSGVGTLIMLLFMALLVSGVFWLLVYPSL